MVVAPVGGVEMVGSETRRCSPSSRGRWEAATRRRCRRRGGSDVRCARGGREERQGDEVGEGYVCLGLCVW